MENQPRIKDLVTEEIIRILYDALVEISIKSGYYDEAKALITIAREALEEVNRIRDGSL